MTAKLSTAYDSIRSKIALALPSRVELADPYNMATNLQHQEENGWGVAIGTSTETPNVTKSIIEDTSLTVVLSSKIYGAETEAESMAVVVKSILDDAKIIRSALIDELPSGAVKLDYIGRGSVQKNLSNIYIQLNFSVSTFEEL